MFSYGVEERVCALDDDWGGREGKRCCSPFETDVTVGFGRAALGCDCSPRMDSLALSGGSSTAMWPNTHAGVCAEDLRDSIPVTIVEKK